VNLGFVGVGPWAQKLAAAFRECGAEVVAIDRKRADEYPPNCFASEKYVYQSWRGQIENPTIDAIIACAPPDVTTAVALECAKAGKRCVATKPLMWTEMPLRFSSYERLTTCLYVDLWRLYSPAWLAMKEELRGKKIDRIDVAFCGNGPFRSFNGALDYGPHALAFVFDLMGTTGAQFDGDPYCDTSQVDGGRTYIGGLRCADAFVTYRIGNGSGKPERSVRVRVGDVDYTWSEPDGCPEEFYRPGEPIMFCAKTHSLRRFCRAFMAGEPSRTLEYSICAQRLLERIIGAAK